MANKTIRGFTVLPQEYEVEAIVDKRVVGKAKHYLVKWKGYPSSQNTWEPKKHLQEIPDMVESFEEEWRIRKEKEEAAQGKKGEEMEKALVPTKITTSVQKKKRQKILPKKKPELNKRTDLLQKPKSKRKKSVPKNKCTSPEKVHSLVIQISKMAENVETKKNKVSHKNSPCIQPEKRNLSQREEGEISQSWISSKPASKLRKEDEQQNQGRKDSLKSSKQKIVEKSIEIQQGQCIKIEDEYSECYESPYEGSSLMIIEEPVDFERKRISKVSDILNNDAENKMFNQGQASIQECSKSNLIPGKTEKLNENILQQKTEPKVQTICAQTQTDEITLHPQQAPTPNSQPQSLLFVSAFAQTSDHSIIRIIKDEDELITFNIDSCQLPSVSQSTLPEEFNLQQHIKASQTLLEKGTLVGIDSLCVNVTIKDEKGNSSSNHFLNMEDVKGYSQQMMWEFLKSIISFK